MIFLACFFVKDLWFHSVSLFTEARHYAPVGRNVVAVMMGLKWFNQYGVTVTMEFEHDVAVARVVADDKPAHVISIAVYQVTVTLLG